MPETAKSFDVLMPTYNASVSPSEKDEKNFLIRCLNSVYREIPVNRLIVCDGGSTDNTLDILNRYEKVDIHVRPDIKTMLAIRAFLISMVESEWFILIDSDVELPVGWFDAMNKGLGAFDYYDSPRKYMYEYEQDRQGSRSWIGGTFGRTAAFKEFSNRYTDDDYGQRVDDIVLRQFVSEKGLRYGRIKDTFHWHNCSNQPKGQQHFEAPISQYEFQVTYKPLPENVLIEYAYACAKYVDPESPDLCGEGKAVALLLKKYVPREWIAENGKSEWLQYYDEKPDTSLEED